MLERWQKAIGPAAAAVADDVAGALAAAEKAGPAGSGLLAGLADAKHDAALVVKDGSRGAHNPWFARKLLESSFAASQDAWSKLEPSRAKTAFPLAPKVPTKQTCALVCHVGVEDLRIGVPGTRFDHSAHLLKSGRDCDACHSTAEHGKTLVGKNDCAACHHGAEAPKGRDCASCHEAADKFLRGTQEGGEAGAQMMAKVACGECHGDATRPAGKSVREVAQSNCDRCHGDKYKATVAEWTADSDAWFKAADVRLAKIRARVASGKTTEAKAAPAAAVVERLRLARPAHNVLAFEEQKDAFEEAASAAEK